MILEKLKLVPHKPGCYLMHNADDEIIYIGNPLFIAELERIRVCLILYLRQATEPEKDYAAGDVGIHLGRVTA